MWFSAIPCMWCVVVGLLFSLYKPQDPKTLNPELISPGLKSLFKWWPRRVTQFIDDLQIGSEYVSRQTSECKQNVRFTHRFYHVLPRLFLKKIINLPGSIYNSQLDKARI